jgi:hypothetical protein
VCEKTLKRAAERGEPVVGRLKVSERRVLYHRPTLETWFASKGIAPTASTVSSPSLRVVPA